MCEEGDGSMSEPSELQRLAREELARLNQRREAERDRRLRRERIGRYLTVATWCCHAFTLACVAILMWRRFA